ncbi:hypothetical protein LOD99_3586 [Oopsacas minuta]|uniref:Intermembrane lipid transfer protein VPS13-like C-terminal domain-containing protein n=1 Tax=Oopsacas minuta TaxID=111878 RepID=A0AAV7JZB6_9METZ|nr:hypothetical protein LOD99_3586 [Oopsacas minuta]
MVTWLLAFETCVVSGDFYVLVINNCLLIRVFDLQSALGNFILNDIENAKYLRTLVYKGHLLIEESKNIAIFIVTNKLLIKAERKNFDPLNPWKDEAIYPFEEITHEMDLSLDGKKTILILHIVKHRTLFSHGKPRVMISTSDHKSADIFAAQFNQALAEFNSSY